MKKIISVLLASLMVATLAACGAPAASSSAPAAPAPAPSTSASAPSSSAPSSAPAASTIKTAQAGKLVIGTSADFAPYEFHALIDGKDQIVGFDMALAKAIADDMGLELVVKDISFDSILVELGAGTVDLGIAGFSPDPERAKSVDFSDLYYTGGQSLMVKKADAAKYKSFADFKGLSVAAQTGSIQEKLAKANTPDAKLVALTKIPDIIMELKAGKVAGAYIETIVAKGYEQTQTDLMIAMNVPYDAEGSCVAVKKDNAEMLAAVNASIKKLVDNGSMDKFVQDASALMLTTGA